MSTIDVQNYAEIALSTSMIIPTTYIYGTNKIKPYVKSSINNLIDYLVIPFLLLLHIIYRTKKIKPFSKLSIN